MLPISDEMFLRIRSGLCTEDEIERGVLPYRKAGYFTVYISSVVVDKEKFPRLTGLDMFIFLGRLISSLKKRGVFIRKAIAVAVSDKGARLLQRVGFRYLSSGVYIASPTKKPFIKENPSFLPPWFLSETRASQQYPRSFSLKPFT